jgi:pyruvate dehydrogenase E1 component
MPKGVEEGIVKGLYLLEKASAKAKLKVQLLGAGSILNEARQAKQLLLDDWGVDAVVWSVTSVNELFRQGKSVERWNMLHPDKKPRKAYITEQLEAEDAPVVLATDYLHAYGEQLRPFVPKTYRVLGTDGFGRSDTRSKLRWFFEVDRHYIVVAALTTLADEGKLERKIIADAMKKYGIDPDKPDPVTL